MENAALPTPLEVRGAEDSAENLINEAAGSSCQRLTLKGLLGTLTSPQVMMMVCLMDLTGVYTQ